MIQRTSLFLLWTFCRPRLKREALLLLCLEFRGETLHKVLLYSFLNE